MSLLNQKQATDKGDVTRVSDPYFLVILAIDPVCRYNTDSKLPKYFIQKKRVTIKCFCYNHLEFDKAIVSVKKL
jgi:hypothetical protein